MIPPFIMFSALTEHLSLDLTEFLSRHQALSVALKGGGIQTMEILSKMGTVSDHIIAQPRALPPWVDMTMLALDGAWRSGHMPRHVIEVMKIRQQMMTEEAERRGWKDPAKKLLVPPQS